MEAHKNVLCSEGQLSPLPPWPREEAARLQALCSFGILDSAPDPSFDRLTQLASTIFKVPHVFISFIDQSRQWFKSTVGGVAGGETPRTTAFCAYTILSDEVNVVLNATEDARFSSNPVVTGPPRFRFYAGAPIMTKSGYRIGSFCILDTEPKDSFGLESQAMLRTLADLAYEATEAHLSALSMASDEAEARSRFDVVASATIDGLWDWNIETKSVYYSPRWQQIVGFPERELKSDLSHWMDRVHPEDRPLIDAQIQAHLRLESSHLHSEHRVRHGDGSWRWIAVRGLAQRSRAGKPMRMAGSISDITGAKTSDTLTGLPNRMLFVELLARSIERARAAQSWNFAVLFVDVDRFKQINDRVGHLGGDLVLKAIASRLAETVARTRISPDSMVARFAGDEFVILLGGIENCSQAFGFAQRLHNAVSLPIQSEVGVLTVGISIGIAMARPGLDTPEMFLQHSDIAMYRAKASAPGSTVVFDPIMQEETAARLELEDGLRGAIEANELRLYYQPQLDLSTGEISGCEALVRWQHPKRGLLAPGHFIDMAEEIGMVSLIDSWVLKTACQQLAEWRAATLNPEFKMSVNVSGHSLAQRGLKYAVQSHLAENDLPADSLCLELTESVFMADVADSIRVMQELRAIGVGLHIDDFGSGYSSFKYLYDFPFDTLKVDRSLMVKFPMEAKAKNVMEGILSLAHKMGLRVIAEGVEESVQADALREMGCECGQGYLFDRPLTAHAFRERYLEQPPFSAAKVSAAHSLFG